jgi:hypothetical protein
MMKFDFFTIFFDFFWSSNGKRWVDDVTLIRHDKSIKEHHTGYRSLASSAMEARAIPTGET